MLDRDEAPPSAKDARPIVVARDLRVRAPCAPAASSSNFEDQVQDRPGASPPCRERYELSSRSGLRALESASVTPGYAGDRSVATTPEPPGISDFVLAAIRHNRTAAGFESIVSRPNLRQMPLGR